MNGSAAEFVPRRPASASSFTPNAAALPFMMPGLLSEFNDADVQWKHRLETASRLVEVNGRPPAGTCCRQPCTYGLTPIPPPTRRHIASERCCAFPADLTRARTGGLDSAGPSSPAVRLPEEDDLFGLGMTGFVPSDPAGSASAGPAAQSLDAAMRGLALSQPSPTQRDPQQHGGGGHAGGAADGRRPTSAGLAAADPLASPVKCAPMREFVRSACCPTAGCACWTCCHRVGAQTSLGAA